MQAPVNFNCTIQELKPVKENVTVKTVALFQLHHTGIKTNCSIIRSSCKCHFNCTIQELKPIPKNYMDMIIRISIAPYRN